MKTQLVVLGWMFFIPGWLLTFVSLLPFIYYESSNKYNGEMFVNLFGRLWAPALQVLQIGIVLLVIGIVFLVLSTGVKEEK